MELKSIHDSAFSRYARIIEGYDIAGFVEHYTKVTELPKTGFTYVASVPELESQSIFQELKQHFFGGLPIQLGYCNGTNTTLDAVEYHKCSELCITASATVFILGSTADMTGQRYDTKQLEAFLVPTGTMLEILPYTLHYAPCDGRLGKGFRVAVALLQGTCGKLAPTQPGYDEDKLLVSANKWMLCHPRAATPEDGAPPFLEGEIIDITGDIMRRYEPL